MFQWIAKAFVHTEWKLASLGIACAVSSVGFASYMISHSDEAPGLSGGEHFAIFARPSTTKREPFMKFQPPVEVASQTPEVDLTPIGTIMPRLPSASRAATPVAAKELSGFYVRGAFDGKVLVQGPTGFELVGPGDKLTDAGPVLSIKYDRGRWIVLTEAGSISSTSAN